MEGVNFNTDLKLECPEAVIMDAIVKAVEPWARKNGGKAQVAEDPQHSIDQIVGDMSGGLTVSVFWGSDNISDESRIQSYALMDGIVNVALSRPITAELDKAKAIRRTLTLCHELRDIVTKIDRMTVPGLQMPPSYGGKSPVVIREGKLLNGYLLRFRVLYLCGEPGE